MGSGKKSLMVCGSRRRKRNSAHLLKSHMRKPRANKNKVSLGSVRLSLRKTDAGRECGRPKITISAATNNAGREPQHAAVGRTMMRVERWGQKKGREPGGGPYPRSFKQWASFRTLFWGGQTTSLGGAPNPLITAQWLGKIQFIMRREEGKWMRQFSSHWSQIARDIKARKSRKLSAVFLGALPHPATDSGIAKIRLRLAAVPF